MVVLKPVRAPSSCAGLENTTSSSRPVTPEFPSAAARVLDGSSRMSGAVAGACARPGRDSAHTRAGRTESDRIDEGWRVDDVIGQLPAANGSTRRLHRGGERAADPEEHDGGRELQPDAEHD